MEEEWRKIEGYEGYEISNLGRIKSYRQDRINGKITVGNKDGKGYLTKVLYDKESNVKTFKVHRLVALAFIPNPFNLPQINHKDENKTNNNVDNLEWCDNNYNIHYGTKIERTRKANECCPSTSKKVYSIDEWGNVEYYNSINFAARSVGTYHGNILAVLEGRRKHAAGREWHYQNNE